MKPETEEKIAEFIGRVGGCVVIGFFIGLMMGNPKHLVASLVGPIVLMLILEFTGILDKKW